MHGLTKPFVTRLQWLWNFLHEIDSYHLSNNILFDSIQRIFVAASISRKILNKLWMKWFFLTVTPFNVDVDTHFDSSEDFILTHIRSHLHLYSGKLSILQSSKKHFAKSTSKKIHQDLVVERKKPKN